MRRKKNKFVITVIMALSCFLIGIFLRNFSKSSKVDSEEICEAPLCHADSLRLRVISTGDIQAYLELKKSFESTKFPCEILFYSIVMAKQYGYEPAYKHASHHLRELYKCLNVSQMDSFTDSICKSFEGITGSP